MTTEMREHLGASYSTWRLKANMQGAAHVLLSTVDGSWQCTWEAVLVLS